MKDEFESLLQKKMDRRSFLKHVAVGFAAITGVAGILKTLNQVEKQSVSYGYGASVYGGAALHKQP